MLSTFVALFQVLQILNSVGCSVCFVQPISVPRPRIFHRPFNLLSLPGSFSEEFERLSQEFKDCSVPEIQNILVHKGLNFKEQQDQRGVIIDTPQSPLEKIPGCVANVYVQTRLRKLPSEEEEWGVAFGGNADALLSRGLLAVLTNALASMSSLEDILQIDPYMAAEHLGIRPALSPGRNDGLANMMQIIQSQIKNLLKNEQNAMPSSIDVAPLYVEETKMVPPSNPNLGSHFALQPNCGISSKNVSTVALLLSGGVDSSVALRLLLQQGYNVTAFYLKIWLEDELAHLGQCPWEEDYKVCRQVCEQAGVPLESLSLQEEYREQVISYTIHEAQRGRTPNPDILCNSRVKFGCFYEAIAKRDFDFVASGHYARLEPDLEERVDKAGSNLLKPVRLFRAPDPVKDQSYFLCALAQKQLQRAIFPIGHLEKAEVRELANNFALPNRHRPDSQGLCFLGKVKFEDFLGAYLGERPGDIVDASTGDLLGRHKGVWYHTVGQRKGIGKVLDPLATSRGPWYVVAKDPDQDLVFCSNQYDEETFAAARSEFHVEDIHWIAGHPPTVVGGRDFSARFDMKIRHGPRIVSGILALTTPDGSDGSVKLDQKDGGLAPGQYVVFYDGEECLGGGVISERHWATFLRQHEASYNTTVASS